MGRLFRDADGRRTAAARGAAWKVIHRHRIPASASYVALAEALGLPLMTLDRKLAKTAQRFCDIHVL